MTRDRVSFRPFTGPASLKGGRRPTRRRAGCRFPALHRAGLIEGPWSAPPPPPTRSSFRPFTGPASLKVRGAARGADHGGPFPALHRAGLIEGSPRSAKRCRSRCFRPFTGPASLKGRRPGGSRYRLLGFRPFTGPASLKAAAGRVEAAGRGGGFPALHRAGLIEGAPAGSAPAAAAATFPALHRAGLIEGTIFRPGSPGAGRFPALHRAGLIEGRGTGPCLRTPGTVSGPSQGRPH